MVKNTFSPKQRKIIRKICKIQIKSLVEISRKRDYMKSQQNLSQDGIFIPSSEYEAIIKEEIELFTKVHQFPSRLYMFMGEGDIWTVKHILFNCIKDQDSDTVRNIWRKLFLSDYVVKQNNQCIYPDYKLDFGNIGFNLNEN
jgi:hypothetical protein